MPKKQMPAAERQRETSAVSPVLLPGTLHNWPDTGPGARARKRADVGRWAGEARQLGLPEPKDKLDAMTGYSFSTPVWEDGQWVVPAVAEVRAAVKANGPEDRPRDVPAQWDRIDWRAQEEQVRRLRQRIFTAAREQDWPKVRNLQKLMLRSRACTLVIL
jgi:hypothetical protein